MSETTPACRNCVYFIKSSQHASIKRDHCRRYPPSWDQDGSSLFPWVNETLWCGEWKAKAQPSHDVTQSGAMIVQTYKNGVTITFPASEISNLSLDSMVTLQPKVGAPVRVSYRHALEYVIGHELNIL